MEQKELFDDPLPMELCCPAGDSPASLSAGFDDMDEMLRRLGEISPNARDDAIRALLSEYPLRREIYRFVQKILNAAEAATADAAVSAAADAAGPESEAGRRAAERARTDRLDPGTEQVEAAAAKTVREFDRLRGLLRFKPENGVYTARCTPDHFVLPLLAGHFQERFGAAPWAIIDEKRKLLLKGGGVPGSTGSGDGGPGGPPILRRIGAEETSPDMALLYSAEQDTWEELWKRYHRSVNNEERTNPALQKQFMPQRYWKYLPEMGNLTL